MIQSILRFFRSSPDHLLEKTIGYRFRDPKLLAQALLHRSWLSGRDMERWESNERLEFLGDSILNMLVTEYLYRRWPRQEEGDLSKKKSAVVSGKALAECARGIDLGSFLRLGKGEERTGGRDKENILADAFEATLGAVFLDGGIRPCRRLLEFALFDRIDEFLADGSLANYKSLLLESLQGNNLGAPEYRLATTKGPEHSKEFRMEVLVQGKQAGSGRGGSKKAAEQQAARDALLHIFGAIPGEHEGVEGA